MPNGSAAAGDALMSPTAAPPTPVPMNGFTRAPVRLATGGEVDRAGAPRAMADEPEHDGGEHDDRDRHDERGPRRCGASVQSWASSVGS